MTLKLSVLLVFFIIFFPSCSKNTTNVDGKTQEQVEREKNFSTFQEYVDRNYPNWKVSGIRKEETTTDDFLTERAFYYLLLNDGKTNQVLFVVKADFQNIDGSPITHIYEPSKETLQKRKEYKLKEQENEKRDDEPIEHPEPF